MQQRTTTKVKVTSNGTRKVITRSQKVHSGTQMEGTSYTPDPAIRRNGIEKEYIKVSWYNPELNKKDWERSEARKQVLLEQIRANRAEIRGIITNKHPDPNTVIYRLDRKTTNKARRAIMSWNIICNFVDQLFTQGKMQLS